MLLFLSLFFSAPSFAACEKPESFQRELQYFNSVPSPRLNAQQLEGFFRSYEDAHRACPGLRKQYDALFGSEGYEGAKTELVSRWHNAYGSDIGDLPSSLMRDDFPPEERLERFRLPENARLKIMARKNLVQERNREARNRIKSLPSSNCSSVNLRPKLGPLKLQGKTGMCASFVTADLLTLETGKPVSPMSLMMGLGKYDGKGPGKDPVGDRPDDRTITSNAARGAILWEPLVIAANETGFCSEADMPSNWDDILQVSDSSDVLKTLAKIRGREVRPEAASCDRVSVSLRRLFPSAKVEDLLRVAEKSQDNLMSHQFQSCRQTLPPETVAKYQHYEFGLGTDQDLKKKILDSALDRGGMVMSEISTHLLKDPMDAAKKPNHAVGIVGRRLNPATGDCEYLVRNSMGDVPLDPAHTRESEGHVWVAEKTILRSLRQMVYKKH